MKKSRRILVYLFTAILLTSCGLLDSAKQLVVGTQETNKEIHEVVKEIHDWIPTILSSIAALVLACGAYVRSQVWKRRAHSNWIPKTKETRAKTLPVKPEPWNT